jgi:anthranilate synthase component 2
MHILVIDNYDSFVYNLVYMLRQYAVVTVVKNDELQPAMPERYDKILLSPGPGLPAEAGQMPDIIRQYAASKSILGICLGHQAIAEHFGASLYNLPEPLHGLASQLSVQQSDPLLADMPARFQVGHYHSWVVNRDSCPPELELLATDERGNIMALRHRQYAVYGLQFHPESVLTEYGHQIIKNWIHG